MSAADAQAFTLYGHMQAILSSATLLTSITKSQLIFFLRFGINLEAIEEEIVAQSFGDYNQSIRECERHEVHK